MMGLARQRSADHSTAWPQSGGQPSDGTTRDIREYYDALAREFDAQDAFWDNPYDIEIWRLEHELIRPYLKERGRILDIGCGFYPHIEFAAGRSVVAGDISLESLRRARNLSDGSGRIDLVQFDVLALPFTSASMTCAIAGGELLNHLPDCQKALREIRRVLRPGGILLVQVGAKWCLDTLWAILDGVLGNPIGYAITRQEAFAFIRLKAGDVPVTWAITPSGKLRVSLLSIRKLKTALVQSGFRIHRIYGANVISGLVPLPVQQKCTWRLVRWLVSTLILLDRLLGRLPLLRTFAGNVFFLCEVPKVS